MKEKKLVELQTGKNGGSRGGNSKEILLMDEKLPANRIAEKECGAGKRCYRFSFYGMKRA